jgi:transcriptional regulator with XRE-family HTH domain
MGALYLARSMSAEPEPMADCIGLASQGYPAVDRRRLGAELRQLRERAGLRLEDVASRLGVVPSTLSRIETGKAPTRTSYITVMLDLYGMADPETRRALADLAREGQRKDWWTLMRDLLPAGASTYLGLEAAASEVRTFSALTVPGLLQTADYATALLKLTRPGLSPDEASSLVTLQLRRQEQLRRREQRLHLILDESVLLRIIGSASIMAQQLGHLAAGCASPAVTIQVVPLTTTMPALSMPFTLLSFTDQPDSFACQIGIGDQVTAVKRAADVNAMRGTFDSLANAALPAASSPDALMAAAERYEAERRV